MYPNRAVMQKYRMPEEDPKGGGDPAAAADPAADPAAADPAAPAPKTGDTAAADPKAADPKAADPAAPKPKAGDPAAADPATGDPWGGIREKIAGQDQKLMARLNRYATPEAAIDALVKLQNRISAGEMRSTLPKNATAEQVAAWRTENGIPEAPDKYELTLREGLEIKEADKPIIAKALEVLHGKNATADQASAIVDWYYAEAVRQTEERAQKDKTIATQNEDILRAEWKDEFRPNMNMVSGLLSTMPADVQQLFMGGRLANGDPIMASASVMKALNSWAREINPVGAIVPAGGANVASAIEDEIAGIEKKMGAPKGSPEYKEYWENDKTQTRYRELLDGRDRVSKKGG